MDFDEKTPFKAFSTTYFDTPSKSWTTSVTNKQTIFLNFDTWKSFVLRYLVSDDDMGENHYPKHWKNLDFIFLSKSYFLKYIILEGL